MKSKRGQFDEVFGDFKIYKREVKVQSVPLGVISLFSGLLTGILTFMSKLIVWLGIVIAVFCILLMIYSFSKKEEKWIEYTKERESYWDLADLFDDFKFERKEK